MTDDQLEAEWLRALASAPPPCKCSHAAALHGEVSSRCGSVACGCTTYRAKETQR